jgi:cysteine synthase A
MPPSSNLKLDQSRRVARVREILRDHPDYHWMRQYHDDIHYLGYEAVAESIYVQTGGGPLVLVGGVGSGASTGALAHYLRKRSVDVRLVGVQPYGSVTFGSAHVADPEIIIAGIGSSIPFGNVRHDLYDTLHWLAFDAALAGSVDLLRRHAVFAGLSTGAAYLAACWEHREEPARTVLFIAADTGHRYVDTVFARHREASRIEDLVPRQVRGTDELALPWSRMNWNGSFAPDEAVLR